MAAHRLSLVAASGGSSLVAVHRLLTVGASLVVKHRLRCTGSAVVTYRLSCFTACRIFPNQRWNLYPLHWQADSYLRITREVLPVSFWIQPRPKPEPWERDYLSNLSTHQNSCGYLYLLKLSMSISLIWTRFTHWQGSLQALGSEWPFNFSDWTIFLWCSWHPVYGVRCDSSRSLHKLSDSTGFKGTCL